MLFDNILYAKRFIRFSNFQKRFIGSSYFSSNKISSHSILPKLRFKMKGKLVFLSILSIFTAAEACDGGSEGWGGAFQPAKVNQEIVDFAVSQFSGIEKARYNIEVENFQSKVL